MYTQVNFVEYSQLSIYQQLDSKDWVHKLVGIDCVQQKQSGHSILKLHVIKGRNFACGNYMYMIDIAKLTSPSNIILLYNRVFVCLCNIYKYICITK